MTDKKDDVAGKMPVEPELPDLSGMEMPSMKEIMDAAQSAMGAPMRIIQELQAWQAFAAAAAGGTAMAYNSDEVIADVVDIAIKVADRLLVHWKERRDAMEQAESAKK
jgi:hypothetical protein